MKWMNGIWKEMSGKLFLEQTCKRQLALQGPLAVTRNHNNDTEDGVRGQHWITSYARHVRKAEFWLLDPTCPIGAAKPEQNTHNPELAFQGPFGTAEGRETMTTTPEIF